LIYIDTHVPVAVAVRDEYGALPIVRTLGRLGVSVYLIAQAGAEAPVFFSRYVAGKMAWNVAGRSEAESLALLRKIGATLTNKHGVRPILLTPSDWFAIFVERHGDELAEYFNFPKASMPVVAKLLDKWEMYKLAVRHKIPTPLTARPTTGGEVDRFVAKTGFPLVVKPADPYLPDHPTKAVIRSRRELMDAVRHELDRSWNFVVQEYIPGGVETVWMCNGYFGRDSGHGVVFTGKKLRQLSATGVASLAVCVSNSTVADQTYRFMTEVGYRGCVGVGYRQDKRDGTYKVLDVNARVSSVFRLFTGANKLDVVRLCYLDLSGQPIGATTAQEGRKWLLEGDIRAVLPSRKEDRVTVREWTRSLGGVQELHWFARDDVLPFVAWLSQGMVRSVSGLAGQRSTTRTRTSRVPR
jgi:D-aspartate ligase